MNDKVADFTEQWLEGTLDERGEQELADQLIGDAEQMRSFVEANVREQMLRDAVRGVVAADGVRGKASSGSSSSGRSLRQMTAVLTSLAAVLLVAVGLAIWPTAAPVQVASFATITMVQDGAEAFVSGDRLADQTIDIAEGLIRIVFDDGVEVALQGPAKYELLELGRTRLHAGLLAANVPPGAEGFEVETPSAAIVDLGTSFGVQLDDAGVPTVSVFDGEVEVIPTNGEVTKLVREGKAVVVTANRDVESSELDAAVFEKVWPVSSGVVGSSGAFRFAPPWPQRMGLVQSNSEVFVLPEGQAQTLAEPLPVNMTSPGTVRSSQELTSDLIPAGERVRCFLLQFRPLNRQSGDVRPPTSTLDAQELERVTGNITFDRPVLGVVVRGDDLRASDGRFSKRGGQVPQKGRALELFGTPRDDVISLSDDRRTVTLDLAAFGLFVDQVRVIVDQSLTN